jgi:hypothetical protein
MVRGALSARRGANSRHVSDLRRDLETRGQTEVNVMAPLHPVKVAGPERQPRVPDDVHTRLRTYSLLGLAFAVVWLVVNRPFWRGFFMAVSAMVFAAVLLPKEMMFFVRHPELAVALPFASGFVAANLGKSSVGTVMACIVLAVLAVAIYRSLDADPVANSWLRPIVEASNSDSGNLTYGPKPSSSPVRDGRQRL